MSDQKYIPGQRWLSKLEQELGLGIVFNIVGDELNVFFPAAKCQRKYNSNSAPLKRVQFKEGDFIKNHLGKEYLVTRVVEDNGLITYMCDNHLIPESELYDSLVSSEPFERLKYGLVDSNSQFSLRYEALLKKFEFQKEATRGFRGGKIDLLPHQLYTAKKVTDLPKPRVLLSDETGLGKTIEALLILHRMILTDRTKRVLVLLPESLIFQWFAEAIKKFNLKFTIFNKEYYESVKDLPVEEGQPNPFLHSQLFLADQHYLANNEELNLAANSTEWDLLIVDEAHHLEISSSEYNFVHELSIRAEGVLLLTATPEQLGHEEHFNRLKLLDSARFDDYTSFEKEEENYQKIVKLLNKLTTKEADDVKLTKTEQTLLKNVYPDFTSDKLELILNDDTEKEILLNGITDLYGAGRVVFRNTRENVGGFPKRKAQIIELPEEKNSLVNYLADLFKKKKEEKYLLICENKEKVKELDQALKVAINIETVLFHEDLSLLQRDKNVSWFAREDGARILISSGIGSEGRNFQFVNNLIMIDLPENPEVLEQRIGRLDRIGQTKKINIFVPVVKGSKDQLLAGWYQQGLNCFNKNIAGAYLVYNEFKSELNSLLKSSDEKQIEDFYKRTADFTKKIQAKVKKGRDALLEMNSFNKDRADKLVEQLKSSENLENFETFVLKLFNSFNLVTEEQEKFVHKVNLDFLPSADFPLPLIRYEDLIITFLREEAIKHESMEFLTPEHPMVYNTIELLLGSEVGNSVYAEWEGSDKSEIILETVFVAECTAPMNLHIAKYFPSKPLRKVINHENQNLSKVYSELFLTNKTSSSSELTLFDNKTFKHKILPEMLKQSEELAKEELAELTQLAEEAITRELNSEIERLKELRKKNKFIPEDEIFKLENQQQELLGAIKFSRIRLDSVRLVKRS